MYLFVIYEPQGFLTVPIRANRRLMPSLQHRHPAMRAGMQFRLKGKIFAIDLREGERRTEYIPEGEVVDVVARVVAQPDDLGVVEVLWKSTAFLVFVADLKKLGEEVSD
jgi:hypothetical protein